MQPLALVVEDDKSIHLIYKHVLNKKGYNILWAADGAQALELLGRHAPDILFLDMLLPHVDGTTVLDFMRESPHLENTYVVVVSAHSRYEKELGGLAGEFLLKPLQMPIIESAIQHALEQQQNDSADLSDSAFS